MKNYIFGTGTFAIEVAQKMNSLGININGFLKLGNSQSSKSSNNDSIIILDEDTDIDKQCNIIVTKKAIIMGETIEFLRKNSFKNVYVVSEEIIYSEQNSIEESMNFIYKIDWSIPFLNYLEMNVVDQCNLNCKGCAHFSNVSSNHFVQLDNFARDLNTLNKKFYVYYFRILGGEPLLHPNIKDIVTIARSIMKNTQITLVTNGLLIPKLSPEILQSFKDNNIVISISLYQPTYDILDDILKVLEHYEIKYLINDDAFGTIKVIDKFQTSLSTEKKNDNANMVCTGRFCRFLRDGRIAKCYYPLLIEILNKKYGTKYVLEETDYVEIEDIVDGWDTIDKLNKKIPFCDYCRESVFEFDWQGHCKNDEDINSFVLKREKKK